MNQSKLILKKYFGYDDFRPLQGEAVEHIIEGNDALVLMPTGGGKSICYQVPGLVREGLAVIISPLIALMKDQVDGLCNNGVKAEYLNSTQSNQEQQDIQQMLLNSEVDILYLSPEKLLSENFISFLNELKLSLIAIDEAHCISSWGHDFRPEYTKLKILKRTFENVPIVALTATADKTTQRDIRKQLGMEEAELFISSFDRPNISLSVKPGKDRIKQIITFLVERPNQSGIIYCLSRKSTEELSSKLNAVGYKCAYYHAGLASEDRANVQDRFLKDEIDIVCATIAFGMGIDKSNIRWVLHYNLPKNIEGYYQEIGRAGRDGVKSEAILFYTFADIIMLKKFAQNSAFREVQESKLEQMKEFADSVVCRRKVLLNYFGEETTKDCGNCDVCLDPPEFFNGSIIAQKALSAIVRSKETASVNGVIDILRGQNTQKVIEMGYQSLKTFGVGSDISGFAWQVFMMQMLQQGFFEIVYDEHYRLRMTEIGKLVLFESKPVKLVRPTSSAEQKLKQKPVKKKSKKQELIDLLFENLRLLRLKISQEEDIPPYQVFNDATLLEMADEKPVTASKMKLVSGVGEFKFEKYGEEFVKSIISFMSEQSSKGNSITGGTYMETFKLWQEGKTLDEIAKLRKINPITVTSHIAYLYERGHDIDIYQFIEDSDVVKVRKAIIDTKQKVKLKLLYEAIKPPLDYTKIKMCLAYLNKKE